EPVYSNPRSHNAVPPVALAFTVIVPEFPLALNSAWDWLMTESNVKDAQSAGTILIRFWSSALSVPSPIAALEAACQMPPDNPLIREYVFVDAPSGKGALVL